MTRIFVGLNGVLRGSEINITQQVYEQSINITEPISTGTSITLPNSKTYTGLDLEVYLNGSKMELDLDYSRVGNAPYSQFSFLFDLEIGDEILMRVED